MVSEKSVTARDLAPKKKLRLEEKAAIGAAKDVCLTKVAACEYEVAGKVQENAVKLEETSTDLTMDSCVLRMDEGQALVEAADLSCDRKFSASVEISINGDDPTPTAPSDCGDPIHGDDLAPTAPSDCGYSVNGDDPIPPHMQNTSIAGSTIAGDANRRNNLRSTYTRKPSKEASVGPRCFTSSVDLLNCFNQLLHGWPLNHDVNKYEHMMLEDLIKKGHPDYQEKMGTGIKAFQVRIKKEFDTRCFYVIRKDGSMADFSYRKCVDKILPLPKNAKAKSSSRDKNRKGSETGGNGAARVAGCKNLHRNMGREGKHGGDQCGGNGPISHGHTRDDHGGKSGIIRKRF